MFTLWYSVLSYKEYRNKQSKKESNTSAKPKDAPLPPKKAEQSRIPVIEPPKSPVPPPKSPSPIPPPAVPSPPPKPASPLPPKPLEPPAKPPRSPSPHPIKPDAFEDIEYEEEDSEAEEDEEDSVIDSNARQTANSVNDFLNKEINTGLNQR
ncbi:unnamed protein product [Brassicogethes aeneus]|uniref:Uncharacterized protein n=1 Tax=Brassicogethes aeneus TaxID=1431903 RepID=A0A9P0BET8_BRAAE|nr:unnamed protein product [Brassicogethes aeneus]